MADLSSPGDFFFPLSTSTSLEEAGVQETPLLPRWREKRADGDGRRRAR